MSASQPTYEESLAKIASLEEKIDVFLAKKGETDDEDKEMKTSFRKAQSEVKEKEKEHSATKDEIEKVRDAFRRANEETDPEKKKDAMKKAMDEKKDYDKKEAVKKGQEEPKDEKMDKEKDAKIANLEDKYKQPLMNKILQATKIMDPANFDKVHKELTAATLQKVEEDYGRLKPYMATIGLDESVQQIQTPMIPFQASSALDYENKNIFDASINEIDFAKVKTSDIMGMYS